MMVIVLMGEETARFRRLYVSCVAMSTSSTSCGFLCLWIDQTVASAEGPVPERQQAGGVVQGTQPDGDTDQNMVSEQKVTTKWRSSNNNNNNNEL